MYSETTIECPRCHWVHRIKTPNGMHFARSFHEPLQGEFEGDVVREKLVCRNPKCKKHTVMYWYTPKEYLSKI